MEYNWSWLPPRRITTPPPLRPSSEELTHVAILEELNGGLALARDQHFMRSFPHDNVENARDGEFHNARPTFDHLANFSEAPGTANDDNVDDNDSDEIGDENGEDGEVTGEEDAADGGVDEPEEEEPPFDPASVGLKEISNLASFTVSSYKPGCGVKELRDDDIHLFWQQVNPDVHQI